MSNIMKSPRGSTLRTWSSLQLLLMGCEGRLHLITYFPGCSSYLTRCRVCLCDLCGFHLTSVLRLLHLICNSPWVLRPWQHLKISIQWNTWKVCVCVMPSQHLLLKVREDKREECPDWVWLSWLGVVPQSTRLPIWFLVRVQAWVVGSGAYKGQPISVSLSRWCFSPSVFLLLSPYLKIHK